MNLLRKRCDVCLSRRLISLAAILTSAVLLATPAAVQAQWDYIVNANNTNTISIYAYTGMTEVLTIPRSIDNLVVTAVGYGGIHVFGQNKFYKGPTSVTIPNTVTSIGDGAFYGCEMMSYVNIPNGVTSIGTDAFEFCSSLTSITMPGTVTDFETYAFYDCTRLANVTILKGVTAIGAEAFYDCTSLTNVVIPDSVTNIGAWAFNNTKLTSVTIPNGVTSIGMGAFCLSSLASVTIPASYRNIGNSAFFDCQNLTNVMIPNVVTSIGSYAFEYCTSLTNIIIPGSVTNVVDYAFDHCGNLTSVYFEGNAPSADSTSFYADNNVIAYYLPGTVGWAEFSAESGAPVVLWNPQAQTAVNGFGFQANQFGFNISGTSNIVVLVEACTNLCNPCWAPLQTITLTNGLSPFSDSQRTNFPSRFYGFGFP